MGRLTGYPDPGMAAEEGASGFDTPKNWQGGKQVGIATFRPNEKRAAQLPEPLPTLTPNQSEKTARRYARNIPDTLPTNTEGQRRVLCGCRLLVSEAFFRGQA